MDKYIELNTGRSMPRLGLGLYKTSNGSEMESAFNSAVTMGYRLFDTASAYKNEDGLGAAIASCQLPRRELFITTKIWNNAQRIGNIESAFARSLERLGLDYVDLYLIHRQLRHEIEGGVACAKVVKSRLHPGRLEIDHGTP